LEGGYISTYAFQEEYGKGPSFLKEILENTACGARLRGVFMGFMGARMIAQYGRTFTGH
jgi:hypothetical protein